MKQSQRRSPLCRYGYEFYILFVAASVIHLPIACGAVLPSRCSVVVHLHQSVKNHIMGLGVQWDPFDQYPPSTRDWNVILERMDFMHPGFLRVIGGASYSGGRNPKVYFTSNWAEKHNCTKILSWAQKHKCKVILGTWTPALMIKPQNVINWARHVAVHIAYLRRQRGFTCIQFYNFINEPVKRRL